MPELRELLDRALPDAWEAAGSSVDAAMARGSRIRRRRRIASTAAIVGSFLAVVLVASSVVGLGRGDESPPADSLKSAPAFELPALDSGEFYYWDSYPESSDEEAELLEPYDKALGDFLTADDSVLLDPGESVNFSREGRKLMRDNGGDYYMSTVGDKVVHKQPIYYTTFDSPDGESVYVDVFPRGGFTAGSTRDADWETEGDYMGPGDDATYLIACGDLVEGDGKATYDEVTVECEEVTDSTGQEVVRGLETRVSKDEGGTYYYGRIVLYRDDGTAVRVRINSEQKKDGIPALLDAMTELAAALPSDPVR